MAVKLFEIYAPDPLNKQASVLVDVQTDIKTTIKNGVLNGAPFSVIRLKVLDIIENALKKISSVALKTDARKSLMLFANGVYAHLKSQFPDSVMAVAIYALVKGVSQSIADGKTSKTAEMYYPKTNAEKTAFRTLYRRSYASDETGIPLQEFSKTYMQKVENALNDLADMRALDPNDVTGKNGLRNLAEMQVRYERHESELQKLKADGVKLVVCSVHGDCSDRCKEWQGRVYSLDGTYGKTEDGRSYIPLEVATDIYYTTKSGKRYKNGLLGFNCRHKLIPYKVGMIIPIVSAETQKRENAITKRQRELERIVIQWRERALMQKGNAIAHKHAKEKARYWFNQYVDFSRRNNRAYYPDRIKIL
jgi:hypothetical protein